MLSQRRFKILTPYFWGLLFLYVFYWQLFKNGLTQDSWLSYGFFAKYLVPDVFLYKNISESGSSILLNVLAVKNSGYSVLVWKLLKEWYTVYVFNFILVLVIIRRWVVYFNRKLSWFELLIFVNPLWCYYSLGPTKEIPLLFLITLLLTSRQKRTKGILLIAIALIRLHLGVLFGVISLSVNYPKLRNIGVIVVLIFFPLFNDILTDFSSSEIEYRENNAGLGIGSYIEFIKNEIFILSLPAIMFRMLQLLTEPLLSFIMNFGFYNNKVSVIHWLEFYTCVIIMSKVFTSKILTFSSFWKSELGTLLLLISAFSFMHWRYVIIFIPFLILYEAKEKSYS